MMDISVLDLAPIVEGGDAGAALRNGLDLARHAERLGYKRYWMAEHHNMPGIASAATAVALAFVGAGTSAIRIGAGGVMLPNHAPLIIAEQFGTLASLFPGRVDLGLGRAPGTDPLTAQALRRHLAGGADSFPQDVIELLRYLEPASPGQLVRAVPGAGLDVAVWILGSSTFGAQLAAILGLPYAFASHFAPAEMMAAAKIYREQFQPSERLARPHLMCGLTVVAADTDAEAAHLFTSLQQAFMSLHSGHPGPLPPPVDDMEARLDPQVRGMLGHALSEAIVGSPATVAARLADFSARTGADEVMVTSSIFDHPARLRSFEIVAEAHAGLVAGPRAGQGAPGVAPVAR
ncbi:MAG TPA: LLM class flavin-dependent oxidoreductase [Caulobacteraceae bacterium]|jgi:luciferase family oxidoreductase group 1|nr:LLM class flavin-dependent oxidoreductase [Caulobacteraceae bacterium]